MVIKRFDFYRTAEFWSINLKEQDKAEGIWTEENGVRKWIGGKEGCYFRNPTVGSINGTINKALGPLDYIDSTDAPTTMTTPLT